MTAGQAPLRETARQGSDAQGFGGQDFGGQDLDAQGFDWAIAPMTPDTFMAEYFERRHLVIHRDDPAYYGGLLSLRDIDDVLCTQVLPVAELQLVNQSQPVDEEDYSLASGHVDPVRATQAFQAGATMILPALHRRLPRLAAFCRALEGVFNCDLQTNIYLTPADAQGFRTHYDSHDVLVLQCHGTKTWRIYDSALKLPLLTQAFEPQGYEPGALIDEFVLQPGDMAYIPRGVAHDAIATDQVSLHVTTGLLTHRWVDLLIEVLGAEARRNLALRHALPPGYVGDADARAAMAGLARDLLRQVADQADTGALVETFADAFRRRLQPVVPGHFGQALAADGLEQGDRLGVRPGLIWALRREAGEDGKGVQVVLQVHDGELGFPAAVEPSLRAALGSPAFAIGGLPGGLDAKGQLVLARRLLREGVLRRLD